MTKSVAKVSDAGYTDVIRNRVAIRVFLMREYIIAIRPDVILSNDTPYVPIIERVDMANETPYMKYRDVVFSLMTEESKEPMFRRSGEFRNAFPKKDSDTLKRLVSSLYRKYYSLKVMTF